MVQIGVVGAGVVGLTTATLLQDAFPRASITIIADRFLQDTVSDAAAGIFRPGLQLQGPNMDMTKKWLQDAYKYYKNILNSEDALEAGVMKLSGYAFSSKDPNIIKNEPFHSSFEEYRLCTEEELNFHNMKYGSFFTTLLTECRRFQPYLTRKFKKRGGQIVKRHLESLEELADDFDVICNCSGLGAKDLCEDRSMASLRGQVFKVHAPWIKKFYFVDYDTYIIPGFELVTLGGTRHLDTYNDKISKHDAAAIWEECTSFLPALKDAQEICQLVGLRPYRPTIRVEKEVLAFNSGKTLKVVHNYGHGCYGVMVSPGTSMHAVSLVHDILHSRSKL